MSTLTRVRDRFSLLLLEDNEVFLGDFTADLVCNADENATSPPLASLRGRLKLCTHSILFDPEDLAHAVVRVPFRHVTRLGLYERGPLLQRLVTAPTALLRVQADHVVHMKPHNRDEPYTFLKGAVVFHVALRYADPAALVAQMNELWQLAQEPRHVLRESKYAHVVDRLASSAAFDKALIVDADESVLLEHSCARITPLVAEPGRLLLTSKRLYFDPLNRVGGGALGAVVIALAAVRRLVRRRHTLRHTGLELYYDSTSAAAGSSTTASAAALFLAFADKAARERVYDAIVAQPALANLERDERANVTLRWQSGLMSNYDYLLYLNNCADRTVNDLGQYPVFPWVLADYDSASLDLTKPSTFRDLSKPIGALNPARLATLKERFANMPANEQRFLYGSHYSTPGYVLFYLVRLAPAAMLRLQNGRFDAPDRLFYSIGETWRGCLDNPADVKELTPEFYGPCRGPLAADLDGALDGAFLKNARGLHFGQRANGEPVDDVVLPPWATDAADFVRKQRAALESEYVSNNLHHWIDLIFGYKQRGQAAIRADNLFYHMTYEGAVDIESVMDPTERRAIETQIAEFGQTPSQLFTTPHPARLLGRKPSDASLTNSAGASLPAATPTSASTAAAASSAASLASSSTMTAGNASNDASSFDVRKLQCVATLKLHTDVVSALHLSVSGQLLYTASQDTTAKVVKLGERTTARTIGGVSQMSISGVATLDYAKHGTVESELDTPVVLSSWDNHVYVYAPAYGRVLDSLTAHEDAVSCLALRHSVLATGSWDTHVRVWAVRDTNIEPEPVGTLEFDDEVRCVAMDESGFLIVAGAADGAVMLYDSRVGKEVQSFATHGDSVAAVGLLRDGQRLVSCSHDGSFRVVDMRGGMTVFERDTGDGQLRSVVCGQDALIIGSSEGDIAAYSLSTGDLVHRVKGAHGRSAVGALLAAGDSLLSGADDGVVKVWK